MKVVHVEGGRHLYGGALQVLFLLEGLAREDVDNLLVCPPGSDIAERARSLGIRVREMPLHGDHDLRFAIRLARLLRAERPDVVHLHSRRGVDVLGGLAARWAGIPCVLTRRVDNPEPRVAAAVKYRLYNRIITISEGIRRVLLAAGVPSEKVVCVPSAVDIERYRPGCCGRGVFRAEFGLVEDEKTVAMVAQFIPRKGHRVLIDAIPAVLREHPRTRFLLFGRGPGEHLIRSLVAERALGDRVIFAGFRDDLEHLLPCIDLVVHPAYMEGLGVALLQAAACRFPIVASAVGGIPEVVRDGENGRLLLSDGPYALADAANGLLADAGLRERMGAAGRRRVETGFSVGAMVAANLGVYQQVSARP